jgi:hypothetical protein
MKTARTYVFLFVPVQLERLAHVTVAPGFNAGSNKCAKESKNERKITMARTPLAGTRNVRTAESFVLDVVRR